MRHATTIRLLGLLALLLVGASLATPAVASPNHAVGSGASIGMQAGMTPSTPANNSTQHENPDAVDETGDPDQVKSWLNSRMTTQLKQSTIQLSEGEYEQARGVIGDDYNDMLAKYVDVAGDTTGSEDDETAEEFEEAQTEQQAYVSEVEQYRETRAEYQEAKANGNETRARELARNMSETADRIQALNGNLTESYQTIGTQTGTSFEDETAIIENTTQNITAQQQEITAAEFIATQLSVTGADQRVSFIHPLGLEGRVELENDTPVTGERATIIVEDRSYRVTLDKEGRFSLDYRPIQLPVDAESVRVRYRPPDGSPYLGSNTTVPVTVEQTTPDVAVTVNQSEVAYGDVVQVTGQVTGNDTRVPALPVRLRLGTGGLGATTTSETGEFSTRLRIGAGVQPGIHAVRAEAGAADRAIGPANSSTQLRVVETPTELTLAGEVVGEQIVLEGRLLTAAGEPVPSQTIELALTDSQSVSVTTNETGSFRTLASTDQYAQGSNATITATYRGESTNLESAQAQTQVVLPARDRLMPAIRLPLVLFGLGVLAIGAGGGWAVLRRRQADGAAPSGSGSGSDTDASEASASTDTDQLRQAIGAATARQNDGDQTAAIEQLYPAVRRYLTRSAALPETATHWEFYHTVADTPAHAAWAPVVRDLTEAYEQARFAEASVPADDVTVILDGLDERLDERVDVSAS